MMLKLDKIKIRFGDFALDLSLEIKKGEYFILLGASGVGKSLILELIAGMVQIDSGKIILAGNDITRLPIQKRKVGLVFQKPALFPHMDVKSNIAYGLKVLKWKKSKIDEEVLKISREMGIDKILNRKPGTLSGGEAQRVALARMLVLSPDLLLLDEPLSSLDRELRDEMRVLLKTINIKSTILHVTHDYDEAVSLADRIGIMESGENNISRIVQTGTTSEIFSSPTSAFAARFSGIKNIVKGKVVKIEGKSGEFVPLRNKKLKFKVIFSQIPKVGETGIIIFRDRDVIVSPKKLSSSARNCFKGTVTDFLPSTGGYELIIKNEIKVTALITAETFREFDIKKGMSLYVYFKASCTGFIGSRR